MTLAITYRTASLPTGAMITLTDNDGDTESLPYEFAHFLLTSSRGDTAATHTLYVSRLTRGCEVRHTNVPTPSVVMLMWESKEAFTHELERAMCVALLSK